MGRRGRGDERERERLSDHVSSSPAARPRPNHADGHVAVPLAGYAASAGAMALRLLAAALAVGLVFRLPGRLRNSEDSKIQNLLPGRATKIGGLLVLL